MFPRSVTEIKPEWSPASSQIVPHTSLPPGPVWRLRAQSGSVSKPGAHGCPQPTSRPQPPRAFPAGSEGIFSVITKKKSRSMGTSPHCLRFLSPAEQPQLCPPGWAERLKTGSRLSETRLSARAPNPATTCHHPDLTNAASSWSGKVRPGREAQGEGTGAAPMPAPPTGPRSSGN